MEKYKTRLVELNDEAPAPGPGEDAKGGMVSAYDRAKAILFKYAKTKVPTQRAGAIVVMEPSGNALA
jgi:hypothetical protein